VRDILKAKRDRWRGKKRQMQRRRETGKGEVQGETNGEYRKRTGTERQRKVPEIKKKETR
jgi:hypothetical protein